ncbi:phage virion morphogenesis protein [Leptospirillum ferriphilum]|uniref:Phage virion morphogenesis protein n=1 Tax=Leptospirillum ferriphilum (strain ML-04) TaxID=1048260 RepID=J9ZAL7_LEPFM|nr:HK97 gp10 family phage protein [Leptospirillum ferriphilum]AFS52918.1 hypothetical protein LFML04_0683 [Leptospirillum ferriphilum ML-04]OOH80792.1 hypothetical protein BOX30_05490 [Leptospirillum ferriphilum]
MNSFADLAKRLSAMGEDRGPETKAFLETVGEAIEKEAKAEIGHYQRTDTGPFPEWAELAPSTKRDRVRKGFTENDPLLRTGELRDSITHEVRGVSVAIGSDLDIAVYQEMGTQHIPPRPFLRVAAWRIRKDLGKLYLTRLRERLLGRHL